MHRHLRRSLSALALAAAVPAAADTVVVPTDFATIQEAVDAVQGTINPIVQIASDATFTEMVVVTQSVTIEATGGFTPTLRGTTGLCVFAGGCAVLFNPSGAVTTNFVLSGLRFLPAAGASSAHRMIQMFNQGSALSFLTGEELTFEDPDDTGAGLFHSGVGAAPAGSNRISLRQITATVGGAAGLFVTAFAIEEEGRLNLEDVHLTMTNGSAQGVVASGTRGDGVTLELRDSFFDIAADEGFTSRAGVLLSLVSATVERNRFVLRGGAAPGSSSNGILLTTGFTMSPRESQVLVLDANEFVGVGSAGSAVQAAPGPGDASTVTATNNVVRAPASGFLADPQSDAPSQTGGTVTMTLVNNTVDGSTGSAVVFASPPFTLVDAGLYNNLLTGSGGLGVEILGPVNGTLMAAIGHNGYFSNALGDLSPPLTDLQGVFADPLYLAADDLRLRIGSPMLDAGDNAAPALTPLDFAQQPRIQNGTVDIGAYEGAFQASVVEVPTLGAPLLVLLAGLLAALAVRRLRSTPSGRHAQPTYQGERP
jgi:hypothetical protein